MSKDADRKAGDRIADRYVLEEELGRGAMGAVWRATQLNLGREIALKLLLPQYAGRQGARARFEREARVASQLEHPSAVRIYDFGEAPSLDGGGQLFIAMELLRGGPLRARVDAEQPLLPQAEVIEILVAIADVLSQAHDIGLVHRDLKPENVFLERRGERSRVVVVDFGLAFIEEGDGVGRMTEEGVTVGTPEYIPPEQAAGDEVGPPADVYSLGCLMYEMLTGRTPFVGSHLQQITQHLFTMPTPPSEARRDLTIPRTLEDLAMRMLAKSPAERPSMEVVRGLLSTPLPARGRDRGRDANFLEGRAARMISTVEPRRGGAPGGPESIAPGVEETPLAVVGVLEGELAVGLGANGLLAYIVSADAPLEGAAAVYAPGAKIEELAPLLATGLPVLTDGDPMDLERVTALLRAGVSEVVPRPVRAAALSKKIWRAIRRAQRQGGER